MVLTPVRACLETFGRIWTIRRPENTKAPGATGARVLHTRNGAERMLESLLNHNDEEAADAAAALVADWPPLTQAQRDRLRMVFASRRTTEERRAA